MERDEPSPSLLPHPQQSQQICCKLSSAMKPDRCSGLTRLTMISLALGLCSATIACSGPNAPQIIRGNTIAGWMFLGAQGILVVACFLLARHHRFDGCQSLLLLMFIPLNPVWWVDPQAGDCGITFSTGSFLILALSGGVAIWQAAAIRRTRGRSSVADP